MIVDREHYPELRAAFAAIERDNGGDLIGTIYPGEKINLDAFTVPEAWAHLVPGADRALARMKAEGDGVFETFVIGEHSEQLAVARRQDDLGAVAHARILLNDFFNDWQPEDAPFRGTAV